MELYCPADRLPYMTYRQTIDFLFSSLPMFQRIGDAAIKKDLTNIRKLCAMLGEPQTDFPMIHIAGTNGKGSTSHMLAAIFQQAGWKVGLYTSPHYVDFRERIRINGEMMSKRDVIQFVNLHKAQWKEIAPSFFEITVAMAFDHFRKQKVDIAVIETGLGGRLDSTNIIHPMLSVITNIGFDHMNLLGNTLPEIAYEKAGIIKPGTPVIIGEWHAETASVFKAKATDVLAPIHFASKHMQVKPVSTVKGKQCYSVSMRGSKEPGKYFTDLVGPYQRQNLTTVLETVYCWNKYYPQLKLKKGDVVKGLSQVAALTGMMGRWMVIRQSPLVITDAAHNHHGMLAMLPALLKQPARHRRFVLGFVNDKDIRKILTLFPTDGIYYWCSPDIPRRRLVEDVVLEGESVGLLGKAFKSVQNAYRQAIRDAADQDLIFVGGSSYVVGEFLAKIKKPASGRKQA